MECKYCKSLKKNEEFYKSNRSACVECLKARSREYRRLHPEKDMRTYKKRRDYYKKWYKLNGRRQDPLKIAAHRLVNEAVRRGRITRPSACSACKRGERIEGHHDDYLQPLNVVWLCNRCHRKKHSGS